MNATNCPRSSACRSSKKRVWPTIARIASIWSVPLPKGSSCFNIRFCAPASAMTVLFFWQRKYRHYGAADAARSGFSRRRGVAARQFAALEVGLARDADVLDEQRQLRQMERLWPVDQRLGRIGMEIDQNHVRARHHALGGDVEDIEDAFGSRSSRPDRMRGIDTHRHAGKTPHHRDVGEVDEVAMRIAHVRLHTAEAEHDAMVALARQVFGGVERLVQRDAEAALDEHREFFLAAD